MEKVRFLSLFWTRLYDTRLHTENHYLNPGLYVDLDFFFPIRIETMSTAPVNSSLASDMALWRAMGTVYFMMTLRPSKGRSIRICLVCLAPVSVGERPHFRALACAYERFTHKLSFLHRSIIFFFSFRIARKPLCKSSRLLNVLERYSANTDQYAPTLRGTRSP